MTRNNYIATARCDGELKFFTVKWVTRTQATRVAKQVAESLFCARSITNLELKKA